MSERQIYIKENTGEGMSEDTIINFFILNLSNNLLKIMAVIDLVMYVYLYNYLSLYI